MIKKLLSAGIFMSMLMVVSAQGISMETRFFPCRVDSLDIPFFSFPEHPQVAAAMNKTVHETYFEQVLTDDNFEAVVRENASYDDEHFHGLTSLDILESREYEGIYFLAMQSEFLGAYSSLWRETWFFDLKTGKSIRPKEFFSENGLEFFLNTKWKPVCVPEELIANACGEGDPVRDGECDGICNRFSEVVLTRDSLIFHDPGCYAHVSRACDPYFSQGFSLQELSPFFTPKMRSLLSLETPEKPFARQSWFMRGELAGKYFIHISLIQHHDGSFSGAYFYDRVGDLIELKGQIQNGLIELKEFSNGKHTGTFRFPKPDQAGNASGTWTNASGTKDLTLSFYPYPE